MARMLLPSWSGAVQAWQSSSPPWVSCQTQAAHCNQDSQMKSIPDEKSGFYSLDESAIHARILCTQPLQVVDSVLNSKPQYENNENVTNPDPCLLCSVLLEQTSVLTDTVRNCIQQHGPLRRQGRPQVPVHRHL